MMSTWKIVISALLLGIALGAGSVYLAMRPSVRPPLSPALREQMTNYRFIDPLLACNAPEATTGVYKELEEDLTKLINEEKEKGNASMVSLYFQEYPSGRWVGIDENHKYDPASLLKIVLMIAYFKDEEFHPGSLQKTYVYSREMEDINKSIPFDSNSTLTVGQSYSALELIRAMIIDSDNGAKDVLLDKANEQTLERVYHDLQIPAPTVIEAYTISPRQYSLFFRILYNSTYLNRTLSEKAMSILAEAKYSEGLVGGLPNNVTIAHKFGEHVNGDPQKGVTSVELHDCGLVYGPNLPYFLCVMTTGSSVPGLQTTLQDISRAVFEALDTNKHDESGK